MRKGRNACFGLMAVSIVMAAIGFPAVAQKTQKPNILVIFGDDIGQTNISAYTFGLVGYRTPNNPGRGDAGYKAGSRFIGAHAIHLWDRPDPQF
jgi:hypothetical protein